MTTERVQRQIDNLLDEVEAALAQRDWAAVHDSASAVLRLDMRSRVVNSEIMTRDVQLLGAVRHIDLIPI